MSHNEEVASLVLLTSDLTANSTTYVGVCNEFRTEMTWSNLNLRTILGPMYDKCDRFCLQCVDMFFTFGDGTFGGVSGGTFGGSYPSGGVSSLPCLTP